MNEGRPSLARQAGVAATIALWTLLCLAPTWLIDFRFDPPFTFVTHFIIVGTNGPFFAASAFVPALLLARFARVRRLWHAAILAILALVALGLLLLSSQSQVMDSLQILVSERSNFGESPWLSWSPYFVVHATQVAILLCAYRLIVWHPHRGRSSPEAEPAVNAPPGSGEVWGGTRAEWRAFFFVFAFLALFGGGGFLLFREMQRRQIPAPVWALMKESRDLEVLTLGDPSAHPHAEKIHDNAIVRRVSRSTPPDRAALPSCLRRSLTGSPYDGSRYIIPPYSGPSYAIRITSETKTYDLLVSTRAGYKMGLLHLYEGNKGLATMCLFEPLADLDALLAPLPPQPVQ